MTEGPDTQIAMPEIKPNGFMGNQEFLAKSDALTQWTEAAGRKFSQAVTATLEATGNAIMGLIGLASRKTPPTEELGTEGALSNRPGGAAFVIAKEPLPLSYEASSPDQAFKEVFESRQFEALKLTENSAFMAAAANFKTCLASQEMGCPDHNTERAVAVNFGKQRELGSGMGYTAA